MELTTYDVVRLATGAAAAILIVLGILAYDKARLNGHGQRVLGFGGFVAAMGLVFAVDEIVRDGASAGWKFLAGGLLIGSAVGGFAARMKTRMWDSMLRNTGEIDATQGASRKWWFFLRASAVLAVVLGTLKVAATVTGALRVVNAPAATMMGFFGIFIAYGLYLAAWAHRRKHQGHDPRIKWAARGSSR